MFVVRLLHFAFGAVFAALLLAVSASVAAAAAEVPRLKVGDPLPPLKGEFLTGRDAVLPEAAKGKVTLLLVGFTYGSRESVEPWGEWFRSAVVTSSDRTFFEIPMIGGMGRLAKWFINSGMRKGTPKDLHENVITVYGGTGDWKARLGYADSASDDAYLVLLDRQGIVRWLHHGPFDQAVADTLAAQIKTIGR
jgi:hypothetical protein